uniref:protein-tyrosine-phosphatase n=1 Tax=Culicoides sonorensis TaxID=179676 RepID=A0A336MSX2_CULSO
MDEMSNTLSVEFSNLEPESEYEIKVVGKNKKITDSYTEGRKFVNFPDIFHYKFKTFNGIIFYHIKRNETSLELGLNNEEQIDIQDLQTGKTQSNSSITNQLTFNNLHACADYLISTKSFNMIFNRSTQCQCPEKIQDIQLTLERINDLTIQITWSSVETPNEEYLCGFETYVLYIGDREIERTTNNFYELSLCKIYFTSDVTVLALSIEGLVLGEGAINIPEIQETKLSEYALEFKPNQVTGATYKNSILTRTVLDKYKMCNFEVKVDEWSSMEFLHPCSTNNVILTTTLDGNPYDNRKLTLETPMKAFVIFDVDSNPVVYLCPNQTNQFLTYKLNVTWIEFIEKTNCSENEPVEKVKSYNSSGGELKLDKLTSNSKYNLELEVFHRGFSGSVMFYEKSINTSALSETKIRNLSFAVHFDFNDGCKANITIDWTEPCVMNISNYTVKVTTLDKIDVDVMPMKKTSREEHILSKNLNCSMTYNICVYADNYKESEECHQIKTIQGEINWSLTDPIDVAQYLTNSNEPDVKYALKLELSNEKGNKTVEFEIQIEKSTSQVAILQIFFIIICLIIIGVFIYLKYPIKQRIMSRFYNPLNNVDQNIAINLKDLPNHNERSILVKEYTSIEQAQFGHASDKAAQFRTKNRYKNIHPFDHNLLKVDKIPGLSYINASMIKGYNGEMQFIATQGPMDETCLDFWNMIHGMKVTTIIMLTSLEEGNRVKCSKYYPDLDEELEVDDIKVNCEAFNEYLNYEKRSLIIEKRDNSMKVEHYLFLKWFDHNVPESPSSLVDFVKMLRETCNKFPIVVHCSAGVGRTGTLIALWILIDMIKKENKVNVLKTVLELRSQRVQMVQTFGQYEYLYQCIELIASEIEPEERKSTVLKNIKAMLGKNEV